jgi:hypothetical protein
MFMKRVLPLLILAFVISAGSISLNGQETEPSKKEQRKLEKEQKKQAKKESESAELQVLKNMLENRFFVFQGSRLRGRDGRTWSLSQNINFLAVIDTSVIIQFGFEELIGWNGAGGVTVKGTADNYNFDDGGKSKAMTVSSQVQERIGNSRVYYVLTVRDDGTADMDLTVSGGTYRMTGKITNPAQSGIFVGQYY